MAQKNEIIELKNLFIKLNYFNPSFITLNPYLFKYTNIIKIVYKSPSIFIDGMYFKIKNIKKDNIIVSHLFNTNILNNNQSINNNQTLNKSINSNKIQGDDTLQNENNLQCEDSSQNEDLNYFMIKLDLNYNFDIIPKLQEIDLQIVNTFDSIKNNYSVKKYVDDVKILKCNSFLTKVDNDRFIIHRIYFKGKKEDIIEYFNQHFFENNDIDISIGITNIKVENNIGKINLEFANCLFF